MSTLVPNRRRDGAPFMLREGSHYLELPNTFVTGQHSRFPVDQNTTQRLDGLTHDQDAPKFGIGTLAIALALLIGGVYGLILLVVS